MCRDVQMLYSAALDPSNSGLGGLTVFREVAKARPDARYVYVADARIIRCCSTAWSGFHIGRSPSSIPRRRSRFGSSILLGPTVGAEPPSAARIVFTSKRPPSAALGSAL